MVVPNSAKSLSSHKDSVGINHQSFVDDCILPLTRVHFSEHNNNVIRGVVQWSLTCWLTE